jgi:hypothetical protein
VSIPADPLIQVLKYVLSEIFALHRGVLSGMDQDLAALRHQVDLLASKENLVAFIADIQELIGKINAETNTIATRIDGLIASLNDASTPEQKTAVIDVLTAISARLTTLGADQNNPVPVEPPAGPV